MSDFLPKVSSTLNCLKRNPEIYKFRAFELKEIVPNCYDLTDPLKPYPRSGHRIIAYRGNIYSCGGYNTRDPETIAGAEDLPTIFKELWKFNLASKTWTKLLPDEPMPSELASHTAVLVGSCMIVHGGTGVIFGEQISSTTYVCDLNSLTWSELETHGDIPIPMYGQAAAVQKNKLYTVGGTSGFTFFLTVHVLDLVTKEWKRLDNINKQKYQPHGRYRHEIAIQNNKIYVFGGGTSNRCFGFQKLSVFDLDSCMWDTQDTHLSDSVSTYPSKRLCHTCVHLDDDVFICGGIKSRGNMSCIWKLNLNTFLWTRIKSSLPIPLHFHSATVTEEGQMIIFGGMTNIEEEIRTNDVYSMWLKIPSLSEICWNAILAYAPHLATSSKKKLYEAGIPLSYIDIIQFVAC